MLKEFKEFAFKGNLIEVAVGLVLALAFTAVVTSLVDDVIMPIVAAIFGKPNFDDITFTIGDGVVRIGSFITVLVSFLIVAWVLFLIVKAANRMMPKKDEAAGPTEIELLTEIRDSLRTRNV
ncbi:MAG TPA: large conductance mechanosensitive channel protein MscL [Actinomycetota bacterium]|jgi:large conductance mechanosensitive channel|nr:large conductance mechanosensitive channel protein MscL [Actinomycetota bacterium]